MNVLNLFEIEAFAFLLIFARMSAFLVTWPVLGGMNVPAILKILLSLLLSIVLFPILKSDFKHVFSSYSQVLFYVGKEVFIGLALAQISYMFFYMIQMMADLVSTSLGISSAQLFNPTFQTAATPIDTLYYALAVLFFLIVNGHHMFLTGLVQSYDIAPIYRWSLDGNSFGQISLIAKDVIILGLQLAAPVLVSILLINISLAIVGRAVPQINVLVTSMPINTLAGLVILIVSMPFMMDQMEASLGIFVEKFFMFLKTI
ncbi:flagellar biosynthetic protein FliR [bacterium]|nr:flagellar biosynthetic protein FliR [bacterium]